MTYLTNSWRRVSKRGMIQNRQDERSTWETGVSPTACGCSNRRTNASFRSRNGAVWKSNEIFWRGVWGNGASRHSPLPRCKSPSCLGVVHRVLHNTRCHRRQRHLSNIAWLAELGPGRLARLLRFVLLPHPSWEHNEWLGRPPLAGKLRFFLAYEGVKFIQFCGSGFIWHWGSR